MHRSEAASLKEASALFSELTRLVSNRCVTKIADLKDLWIRAEQAANRMHDFLLTLITKASLGLQNPHQSPI